MHCTFDEVLLFVKRYDRTHDGRLNFNEFSQAFLAFDVYYSSMVSRRGSNYVARIVRPEDVFLPHTVAEFQNMWRTHIRVENAGESLRQRLNARPGFNAFEAFNSLDLTNTGSISPEELRRLLESRGYFIGHKEASQVINKFDKQGKGRVTFAEFQD